MKDKYGVINVLMLIQSENHLINWDQLFQNKNIIK